MKWKKHLRSLESNKQWDCAIDFMQEVIKQSPNSIDTYIYTIYLLMNLLARENYNRDKRGYYVGLLKEYFDESYIKFFNNAEYLFCVGIIDSMSEWHLGIEVEDYEKMLKKAITLAPDNLVYKISYYSSADVNIPAKRKQMVHYYHLLINENSSLTKDIKSRGAFGSYWLSCIRGWFKYVLYEKDYKSENLNKYRK